MTVTCRDCIYSKKAFAKTYDAGDITVLYCEKHNKEVNFNDCCQDHSWFLKHVTEVLEAERNKKYHFEVLGEL